MIRVDVRSPINYTLSTTTYGQTDLIAKYSSVFWTSYALTMAWVLLIVISFVSFGFQNPSFEAPVSVEAALSVKLSIRRIISLIIGTVIINAMIFTGRRHTDKVFMFLCAWLWAAYIDDTLVMSEFVYIPDYWFAELAMALRPIALITVSWMAFETHLRAEN